MKKSLILISAVFMSVMLKAQRVPVFSSPGDTTWHYVAFKNGGGVLEDKGLSREVKTAAKSNSYSQQWALFGDKDNFRMLSRVKHYLSFNGKFTTSTKGVALQIKKTAGSWEIHRKGNGNAMNQWGGAGLNKSLGEWSSGDSGNALDFIQSDIKLPVFSSIEQPTYYFVQFCNGKGVLQGVKEGEPIKTSKVETADDRLWILDGDKENFQLINKKGLHANVMSDRLVLTKNPYRKGFSLKQSKHSTYAPSWEIHPNGLAANKNFNQWGGAGLNKEIGFWDANDSNNPLLFILPVEMDFPDFTVLPIDKKQVRLDNPLTLWYTLPSTVMPYASEAWKEYALPLGNGQLGACLLGGVEKDEIQLNEKTLWTGGPNDNGGNYGAYQNFGSLFAEDISGEFGHSNEKAVKNYLRTLNLSRAQGTVSFTDPTEQVTYNRTYFVSNPDKVVVARYAATEKGKISLRFTLKSGEPGVVAQTKYENGNASFSGRLKTVSYDCRVRIVNKGGQLSTTQKGIEVKGADEVYVYIAAGTDFDAYTHSYTSNTNKLVSTMKARVEHAENKGWNMLLAAHEADFKQYFDRVNFSLEGAVNELPTNELIDMYTGSKSQANAHARFLEQLYFAYGRYLSICSSRGVDLPNNLQGIWNNSTTPPWNSDIHANINVQMNYWPVEATNLSELHLPLCNYIINMANSPQWKKYAKDSGQTVGWTCYTENNIFGGVGGFAHNYVIANAWYVTHLWQHYNYTRDKEFLEKAFPAMWSASQYWMQRMKKGKDGTWECPNEYSPEQGPSEDAVAHAQQIVLECLLNTQKAAQILGDKCALTDSELSRLNDYVAHTDCGLAMETYDGKWGNVHGIVKGDKLLREWKYSPYSKGNKNHRHLSHLMCLFPFSQVTPSSPYFRAAVNSLQMRGDESTGWSMGWKINLWARALDGDHAHKILYNALQHCNPGSGGVFYNLFDVHFPYKFQIDGNFGACSGIAEMLLQSPNDTLRILPALPSSWPAGNISGLKAVGGFNVDITWKEHRPTLIEIDNLLGQPLVVLSKDVNKADIYVNGETIEAKIKGNVATIPSKKGDRIVISYDSSYIPDAISQATHDAPFDITVSDRTVTMKSSNVESVSVYDLQGRKVLETSKNVFTVPTQAGRIVLLEVEMKSKGVKRIKLAF